MLERLGKPRTVPGFRIDCDSLVSRIRAQDVGGYVTRGLKDSSKTIVSSTGDPTAGTPRLTKRRAALTSNPPA